MSDPVESRRHKIVVGIDGSESSKAALHWAYREADLRTAELEVIMTWHPPASAYGPGMLLPEQIDFAEMTREVLRTEVAEVGAAEAKVPVTAVVEEGSAARVLLHAAKGADLLVVGSRGHGGFTGMLLGSVSQHCVNHASCPVVVVRGLEPES